MKYKTFINKVLKMGGVITDPGCCVDFPKSMQIKSKNDAIDIIDIMRYCNDLEDTDAEYSVGLDTPLEKLKEAIKRGNA